MTTFFLCKKCKWFKRADLFPKDQKSWCKACKYAAQRKWREENPDKYKASLKDYYERNKPKFRESAKRWKAENPEKVQAANARYQQKLKMEVLAHYGKRCSCKGCKPETNPKFLTIDHMNSDGKEHRKTFTKNFYKWLIDHDFPDGFRTLCFNCNIGRQLNNGMCPHLD